MRTGPMVVPGGQVTAVAVEATLSKKASPWGREHPHVLAGSSTAFTQTTATKQSVMVQLGTPHMLGKGHRIGGSW